MDLVTGATGHIGNVLVRELLAQKHQVRALVLPGENRQPLEGLPIEFMEGNVLNFESLHDAMCGIENVYHLAGIITILPGYDERVYRVNVEGTKNIIQAARLENVKRLVYVSSIHALERAPRGVLMDEHLAFDPDNPLGVYDRSKAEASLCIQQAAQDGLNAVLVCPTGVVGPHDYLGSEIGVLIQSWLKKGTSLLIDGAYDFVDVRDVAKGIILASEKGRSGQVYILSGEKLKLNIFQEMVRKAAGISSSVVMIPTRLALFFSEFTPIYYRLTHTKPRFTRYSVVTVTGNSDISSLRARQELGYQPRLLSETISDTVSWWKVFLGERNTDLL